MSLIHIFAQVKTQLISVGLHMVDLFALLDYLELHPSFLSFCFLVAFGSSLITFLWQLLQKWYEDH